MGFLQVVHSLPVSREIVTSLESSSVPRVIRTVLRGEVVLPAHWRAETMQRTGLLQRVTAFAEKFSLSRWGIAVAAGVVAFAGAAYLWRHYLQSGEDDDDGGSDRRYDIPILPNWGPPRAPGMPINPSIIFPPPRKPGRGPVIDGDVPPWMPPPGAP